MQKPLIAIFDRKTGLYESNVLIPRHAGETIRDWENILQDKSTRYGKNPEDFELYQIGVFNETNGKVESLIPYLQLSSPSSLSKGVS